MHEVMRPHASSVVQMCVHIARTDNEENVAICLKILLECVRSFRGLVEGSFQAYLAVLMDMFKQVPHTVEEVFGEAAIPLDPDPLADANDQAQPAPGRSDHAEVPTGMKSLKVLHEVAAHIVHLVQAWKSESYNIAHGVLPVAIAVRTPSSSGIVPREAEAWI